MGQNTSKGKQSSKSQLGSRNGGREQKSKTDILEEGGVNSQPVFVRDSSQGSTQSSASAVSCADTSAEAFFLKYKDPQEDSILAEGMMNFCSDLEVDPTAFIVLLIAWKFEARQMCAFTKAEFIKGCQKLKVHDIKTLKQTFPSLQEEVKFAHKFQELYVFTFSFGLDHGSGQRTLPMDMAVPLWELVFSQEEPDILARWCNFLKATGVKGISRDTWQLFLPFSRTISSDLSNYDETEAWPSLFDDFVEFERNGQES